MADWRDETLDDYQSKGLAVRMGYGAKPVLLVVDFINGFTDPSSPLGGDLTSELAATNELLAGFRAAGLPVVFTIIAYEPDLRDAGMWIRKVPSLEVLIKGTRMVEVDNRVEPLPGEYVVGKKFASAFFGTDLDTYLKARGVDTIVMAGCTTSGCIRSSAIDSIQSGYYTIVVREAVGDRAEGPHDANLFDIEAKYGDVVGLEDALNYLRSVTSGGEFAARVGDDFNRWWNQRSGEVA